MREQALANFCQTLRGTVITRDHPDYEEARKLYNGMIDKRPLMIARCTDVADVITAVNFGRDNKLPIAIRGGGHNGPGLGSIDDGLVIDLSLMKGVRVDPQEQTVRVGAGCVTGDVDHATHAFGQAVPFGIISTTGVAGLTLSGGHGYLSRQYGLAVDNLIEADVVLANGSFVVASETQNDDLFWALRGGGGNFGVVTSFLFRTNPAKIVYGGPLIFDLSDAATVMRWYRDFLPSAPIEFYMFFGLQIIPGGDPFPKEHWGKKTCALVVSQMVRLRKPRKRSMMFVQRSPRRSSTGYSRFPIRCYRRYSTGSTQKACTGTGKVISSGHCRMLRSRRISRMPQHCRVHFPGCIFIRLTARFAAPGKMRPREISGTRPGRWPSSLSIPIRGKRRS